MAFYIAASALIEKNGKYLMVKEGKDHVRGKWCLPGGGIEDHEDPVEACRREIKEESGLEPQIDKLITVLKGNDDADGTPAFVFIFKATVGNQGPEAPEGKEIMDAKFKSEEELEEISLRNDEVFKALKAERKNYSLNLDAFNEFVNL